MERVVASVLVPCPYAVHGCAADAMVYHEMAEHEAVCPHAPCFCPEKGCGFAGTTSALVDHFATRHKWPAKVFEYYMPVEVPVKAGVHVLYCRGGEDKGDDVFLLYVSHPESPLHTVSLVRVHPHATESRFGCSVGFSWYEGHYQVSTMDTIPTTSLSEGLPANYLFLVSEARLGGGGGRVVLRVTIDKEMVYGDNYDKLFEEDGDDESYIYDEEEDDGGSSEEEEDDNGSSKEEEDEDDGGSSEDEEDKDDGGSSEDEEDEDDNGSSEEEEDNPKDGSSEECGDVGAAHSGL
jgi:E3 ubiquitin-protein ligase SIAH1